ncbi:hypothetical protein ACFVYA_40595 [Amycolatopsis sp. NPDC058278]|uniref:hypothetical protein n=1 Tax=Amycolatopsis sp. NPDC058278 TaxID=3346417 RepID=UPI0036D7B647
MNIAVGTSPIGRFDAVLDALLGPIVYAALTGTVVARAVVDTLFDELLRPGRAGA